MREQETPSIAEAIAKMMDAGQRFVTQRMELFRRRAIAEASNAGRAMAVGAVGAMLAVTGWLCLIVGASLALRPWIPLAVSFAGFGVIHLAVAAVLTKRSLTALKTTFDETAVLGDAQEDEALIRAALPVGSNSNREESRDDRRASLSGGNRGGDRTQSARAL